jgi:hypothetical protein
VHPCIAVADDEPQGAVGLQHELHFSRNTATKVLDIEPIVRLEAEQAAQRAAALAERALRCVDPSR